MDKGRASKERRPSAKCREPTIKRYTVQTSGSSASPAATIDNDSNASTRAHIVGMPGARIPSAQQQQTQAYGRPRAFSADTPSSTSGAERPRGLAAMHTARVPIGIGRAADAQAKAYQRRVSSSPLGITRDNTLHQQLLLVGAPDSTNATNIVTRLPMEAERPPGAYAAATDDSSRRARSSYPEKEREEQPLIGSTSKTGAREPNTAARSLSHHRTTPSQSAKPSTAQFSQPPQHESSAKAQQGSSIKAQPSTQDSDAADISSRPIAMPKSRLSNLRPTLRQMPKSKQVAQIDAQFSSNGNPVARRPDYFVFEDEPLGDDEDAEIDLSSSYMDDIGFDLEDAELNSDFGKSFDLDMLPDPPPRRLSDYNIGVKDVPIRSPSPRDTAEPNEELVRNNGSSQGQSLSVRNDETDTLSKTHDQPLPPVSATSQAVSATSIQSSAYESAAEFPVTPRPGGLAALVSPMSGRHRTLGLPRNNLMFAKPVITEENANFYIKMLALRSAVSAEELSPQTSPPPPRIENKLQSITTIDEPLDEPVQPQNQIKRMSDQRPSPHRSNFWPETAAPMFQGRAQSEMMMTHTCVEVQAECPRVFYSPTSFASKARDFFRGRPKSKSTAGHTNMASDGRHTAQQPSTKNPTTTTPISTALQQQQQQHRRQTMPSLDATLPHTTSPPGLRKRASTTEYASGSGPHRSTAGGANAGAAHVQRRHTVHTSARAGTVRRRHTVSNAAAQTDKYVVADRTLMPAQETRAAVEADHDRGESSEVVSPRDFPLLDEEYTVDAEKHPNTRLSSSIDDNVCDCCELPKCHCNCCFTGCCWSGSCFTSCWPPFKIRRSGRRRDRQKKTADPVSPEGQLLTNPPASPNNSVFSSLSESWGHIYRSRNAGRPVIRKRDRIGDACAFPFRLGYNCILLCFSPCIGLAREYRSACQCC